MKAQSWNPLHCIMLWILVSFIAIFKTPFVGQRKSKGVCYQSTSSEYISSELIKVCLSVLRYLLGEKGKGYISLVHAALWAFQLLHHTGHLPPPPCPHLCIVIIYLKVGLLYSSIRSLKESSDHQIIWASLHCYHIFEGGAFLSDLLNIINSMWIDAYILCSLSITSEIINISHKSITFQTLPS